MAVPSVTHPAADTLRAFGLGKLDETAAESVLTHVDACPDCRQVVLNNSGENFLNRFRQARGKGSTPFPQTKNADALGPPKLVDAATTAPFVDPSIPPELRDHPQYQVIRELGRGGMGVVYLATNRLMNRPEVLKVMNKALLDREGSTERFLREIRSAAMLSHPNVATAYTALQAGDLLMFAMEYVDGEDLSKLVKERGPLPVVNACYYIQQAALGLQHAFEKGMVHRDIKPQNLILARGEKRHVVKVLDFGLAKVIREQGEDTGLTGSGRMLGTPDYVAPEQIVDAATADIRADIYSLGCTLYFLLSGRAPFKEKSLWDVLQAHQTKNAEFLHQVRPEVPTELAAVVRKMMAKNPADRYQKPVEVAQALTEFVKRRSQTETAHSAKDGLISTPASPQKEQKRKPPSVTVEQKPAVVWETLTERSDSPTGPKKAASPVKTSPARGLPKKLWVLASAAAACMLFTSLLASGVFKVKTKDGTIVLKNLPENAEVVVDGGKAVLKTGDGEFVEISVTAGKKHLLQVTKNGFKVFGKELEIEAGGREPVHIQLEPIVAAATDRKAEFTGVGKWRVEGDELIQELSGNGLAAVMFGDASWTDYEFSAEVKRTAGAGHSLLIYRVTDKHNFSDYGIVPQTPTLHHLRIKAGGLFDTKQEKKDPQINTDDWYSVSVVVRGSDIRCYCNAKEVLRDEDPRNPRGRVALLTLHAAFRFRKILVKDRDGKELFKGPPEIATALDEKGRSPAPPEAKPSPGSARFPFPKEIDRRVFGEWEIKNAELVQPRWVWGARLLFGDKTWTDYDFTVEAQMTDRSCGFGMIFRDPGGELQLNNQDGTDRHKDYMIFVAGAYANSHHELSQAVESGALILGKTALEPAQRLKQGEWYTARVSVRGSRVRCYLNDEKLFDIFAKPAPAGLVGLMTWDAPFRFRKIKVTDPTGKVLLEGLPDLDK